MKNKIMCITFVFTLFFSVLQANAFSVSGFVTNSTGAYLDGINVVIFDTNHAEVGNTTTIFGNYSITGLNEGIYDIEFHDPMEDYPTIESFEAFYSNTTNVEINATLQRINMIIWSPNNLSDVENNETIFVHLNITNNEPGTLFFNISAELFAQTTSLDLNKSEDTLSSGFNEIVRLVTVPANNTNTSLRIDVIVHRVYSDLINFSNGTFHYLKSEFFMDDSLDVNVSVANESDTTPPTAPTYINVTGVESYPYESCGHFDLEWNGSDDNESGIAHYEIWKNDIENLSSAINIVNATNTSYGFDPDVNGSEDGTYYFWVRAVDNAGNIGDFSNYAFVIVNMSMECELGSLFNNIWLTTTLGGNVSDPTVVLDMQGVSGEDFLLDEPGSYYIGIEFTDTGSADVYVNYLLFGSVYASTAGSYFTTSSYEFNNPGNYTIELNPAGNFSETWHFFLRGSCSNYTSESLCWSMYCAWDYDSNECFTPIDCLDFNTSVECLNHPNCDWEPYLSECFEKEGGFSQCEAYTDVQSCEMQEDCFWDMDECHEEYWGAGEENCSDLLADILVSGYIKNMNGVEIYDTHLEYGSNCYYDETETVPETNYYQLYVKKGTYHLFLGRDFGQYTMLETPDFSLLNITSDTEINATLWKVVIYSEFDDGLVYPGDVLTIPITIKNLDGIRNMTNWTAYVEIEKFNGYDYHENRPNITEIAFNSTKVSLAPSETKQINLTVSIPSGYYGAVDLWFGVGKFGPFLKTSKGSKGAFIFKDNYKNLFIDAEQYVDPASVSMAVLTSYVKNTNNLALENVEMCIGSKYVAPQCDLNSFGQFSFSLIPNYIYGAFIGSLGSEKDYTFMEIFEEGNSQGFISIAEDTVMNVTFYNETVLDVEIINGRDYVTFVDLTKETGAFDKEESARNVADIDNLTMVEIKQFTPGDLINISVNVTNNNANNLMNWRLAAILLQHYPNHIEEKIISPRYNLSVGDSISANIILNTSNFSYGPSELKVGIYKTGNEFITLNKRSINATDRAETRLTATHGQATYRLVDFMPDNLPPVVEINNPAPLEVLRTENITLDVNFYDDGDIVSSWYTINGVQYSLGTNETSISKNITISANENKLTVYAKDNSGNVGRRTVFFFKDTTAPKIHIIFPSVNNTKITSQDTIRFEISDYNMSTHVYVDDPDGQHDAEGVFPFFTIPANWDTSDGLKQIIIHANDGQFEVNRTIYVDLQNDIFGYLDASEQNAEDVETKMNNVSRAVAVVTDESKQDAYEKLNFMKELNESLTNLTILKNNITSIKESTLDNVTKIALLNAIRAKIEDLLDNTPADVDILEEDSGLNTTFQNTDELDAVLSIAGNLNKVDTSVNTRIQSVKKKYLSGKEENTTVVSTKAIYNGTEYDVGYFSDKLNTTKARTDGVRATLATNGSSIFVVLGLDKNVTTIALTGICNGGASTCDLQGLNKSKIDFTEPENSTFSVVEADPIVKWSFSAAGSGSTSTGSDTSDTSQSTSSLIYTGMIELQEINKWDVIRANEPTFMTLTKAVVITELEFIVKRELSDIYIKISKLTKKPTILDTPAKKVYKYLQIDSNIDDEDIKSATVSFEVADAWFKNNDINPDTIVLFHHDGKNWEELPTSKTGKTDYSYTYEATTKKFSYFAVGVSKAKIAQMAESASEEVIDIGTPDKNEGEDETSGDIDIIGGVVGKRSRASIVVVILLAIVVVGIAGVFIYKMSIYRKSYYRKSYKKVRKR